MSEFEEAYMNYNRKEFLSQVFKITFPIVLQNLLSAAVSSVDVVMLGYVGQSAISAVSLASQYASVLFMVFFGIGTGVTLLGAQYWGKEDVHAVELIEGIGLRIAMIISSIVLLATLTIPRQMMIIFTPDEELIALGVSYLRVIGFSYFFWSITETYMSALRSVERVSIVTALSSVAVVLNIALNGIFIFGLFGLPKLGVMGVALATSISRGVQLILCIIVSLTSKNVKLRFDYMFVKNKVLFKDFVQLAVPALLNDVSWGLAFSMYSVILGHLGDDMVAANAIVGVVRNFASVFCFAIGSATTIILGKTIGSGEMERADKEASGLLKLTVLFGAVGGVIVLIATPFVLHFANLTPLAMKYLKYMLFINVYYVMGGAVNTTLIAGVFRAGGDTKFGMICDTIDMWVYAVPLGFFAAFVLKLPHMWVYFLLCTDEFVKWPWVFKRYKSKKWLNNITKEY